MALIKCSECGSDVSDKAVACPKCGAKPKKKTSIFTWIIGAIFFVIVFRTCSTIEEGKRAVDAPAAPTALAKQGAATSPPVTCPPACPPIWNYSDDTDKMTGKPETVATIKSSNSLSLEFPYSGDNYGRIYVRRRAGKAEDVLLMFDKGQSMCKSYSDDCRVTVRFDDAPPITFSGQGASDGSSNAVFLSPAAKFIAASKKATNIRVSLEIYKAGNQIFEFPSLTPLVWTK